ncbi:MAG TPA: hypothetical protein ENN38_05530 [Actinobacteria bacterium]|nr:hypothetical protein [Actinomycetota bacterium]
MSKTYWILEQVEDAKFPYRLNIIQGEKEIICLRVQERWPGTKGQIFCLNEEGREWPQPIAEIERVPVVSLSRYGKRLAIVLDRSKNKRCDFLFLKKSYKSKEGEYEQIFWRTQQALRERRPRIKLTLQGAESLQILIDANERYPWRFSGCEVKKAGLPAGDYALAENDGLLAVVERKTFDNLIAEFGRMSSFHQTLGELESYPHKALVIEAAYADFLKADKLKYYSPSFAAKAIGELHAMHPNLSIVFAGNRKLANEWTLRFFSAVKSHEDDVPQPKVAEAVADYKSGPSQKPWKGGVYYEVKKAIEEMPEQFAISELREAFSHPPGVRHGVSDVTLRRILNDLKKEGKIRCEGKGKKSYWKRI